MKSKKPIPRSPRNLPRKPEKGTTKLRLTCLAQAFLAFIGMWVTAFIAFVSQGPESVRKIPEIPGVIIEVMSKTWDEYRIARKLSGTWEFLPAEADLARGLRPVRLIIQNKNGVYFGELDSPVVRKWTIYETALVEGRIDGTLLRLTVFDYVFNQRKEFAKIEISFQELPSDGITDHTPALVLDELITRTTWQASSALPHEFKLRTVAN